MSDPTAVMGRRILAYIIDSLIMGVIVVALVLPYWNDNKVTLDKPAGVGSVCDEVKDRFDSNLCFETNDSVSYLAGDEAGGLYGRYIGVVAVVGLLNFVVLQGITGGSVGKMATGIRVVDGPTGQQAGIGKNAIRWLIGFVELSCCFLIGLITALTSKGHRRLGDMAASTNVVAKSQVGIPPMAPIPVASGGWGAPPTTTPPPGWAPPSNAPQAGWGATPGGTVPGAPTTPPPGAPPAATPPAGGDGSSPQWDEARKAYIQYDQARGAWLQFDDTTQQWKPIDS